MVTRERLNIMRNNLKNANDKIKKIQEELDSKKTEVESHKNELKTSKKRLARLQQIVLARNKQINKFAVEAQETLKKKDDKIRLLTEEVKRKYRKNIDLIKRIQVLRKRNEAVNKRFDVFAHMATENIVNRYSTMVNNINNNKKRKLNPNNEVIL